jgi:protein-arginine kinase activator protein McsA
MCTVHTTINIQSLIYAHQQKQAQEILIIRPFGCDHCYHQHQVPILPAFQQKQAQAILIIRPLAVINATIKIQAQIYCTSSLTEASPNNPDYSSFWF